jgi:hypothetical protein
MRIHKDTSDKDYEEKVRRDQEARLNRRNGDSGFSTRNLLLDEPDF